jgi:hypothetical protein
MVNKQKHALRSVLFKLGIKSAELNWVEDLMQSIMQDFGKPDTLYMSPDALKSFQKTFKKK